MHCRAERVWGLGARPSAGVAMCVYNGGRYLETQLQSIANQTELPQLMAIIDDASTDGSWELLKQWAVAAPFRVTLRRNEQNLGVVRNFEKAACMLLEEVDVLFFSDQDDEWFPDKLATILDAFEKDSELGLIHSDAEMVGPADELLGIRLFDALKITEKEKADVAAGKAYRSYVKRNLVTGAASAVRSSVLRRAVPFSQLWIHDEWIAFTAALCSRVRLLDRPLMKYRLHSMNTVGLPIPDWRWWLRTVTQAFLEPQLGKQQKRLARLEEMRRHGEALHAPADALACLDRAIRHAQHRTSLPRGFLRRAAAVRAEWSAGQYHEWSSGEASVLHDLLIAN
jgi:glycosyltransferase involved in cell wall biosynthesis